MSLEWVIKDGDTGQVGDDLKKGGSRHINVNENKKDKIMKLIQ